MIFSYVYQTRRNENMKEKLKALFVWILSLCSEVKATLDFRYRVIKAEVYKAQWVRSIYASKFCHNIAGLAIADMVIEMTIVAMLLSSIGITYLGDISNSTTWTGAGVDADVAVVGYVLLPTLMILALAIRFYNRAKSGNRG